MADLLAWGVGAILALIGSVLVVVGISATPYLITVIAPGFEGERRELTIAVVRVLFPCTGLLVMSAWCLGVLNSHHKFFMSYAAPVAFNIAMIVTLLYTDRDDSQDALAIEIAWGAVVGAGASDRRAIAADAGIAPKAADRFREGSGVAESGVHEPCSGRHVARGRAD